MKTKILLSLCSLFFFIAQLEAACFIAGYEPKTPDCLR
ncbi:MAG: cyclic lactone autoinducer peptide [Firmicutes bacterium]|nr:cyclic lactone autoinducer peptide [Bacillota bacterium]